MMSVTDKKFATKTRTSPKTKYDLLNLDYDYNGDEVIITLDQRALEQINNFSDSVICHEYWSSNRSLQKEYSHHDNEIKSGKIVFDFKSASQRYMEFFGYDKKTGQKKFSTGVVVLYGETVGGKGGSGDQQDEGTKTPPFHVIVKENQKIPWKFIYEPSDSIFTINVSSQKLAEALMLDGFNQLMAQDFIRTAMYKCANELVYGDDFESAEIYQHFMRIVKTLEVYKKSPDNDDDNDDIDDSDKAAILKDWEEWLDFVLETQFEKVDVNRGTFDEFLSSITGEGPHV